LHMSLAFSSSAAVMSEANTSQRHDTAFSLVPLAFDTIATWQLYVIEAMDPIITLATIIATTDIGVFLATQDAHVRICRMS